MVSIGHGLLLAMGLLSATPHDANVVWSELNKSGVPLGGDVRVTLPEPAMPDGLSAAQQKEKLEAIAGDAYPLPRLLRKSVVSPYILHQELIEKPDARGREVTAYFIAYGNLEQLEDAKLIDRVMRPEDENDSDVANTGKQLDAKALEARGIAWDASRQNDDIYAHGSFTLWKKVEVESTLRTYWTRNEDSVVAAIAIDRRFDADKEFPNRWRSVEQLANGDLKPGEPHPYDGLGMYLKITRLAEPKGALFVEWHLVFSEPQGWFDGANLLGSKMPAIVQSRVRALRRELLVKE
jgi:hypothetical protein